MANILEIKNELFKFFSKNERLILPDDLEKILPGSDEKASDCEIIKLALNSFISGGIVGKYSFSAKEGKSNVEKTGYVLEKPLYSWSQTLEIPGDVAGYVATTINSFRENDEEKVNPLAINYKDIESLIIIIGQLFKKNSESQKVINNMDLGSSGLN